MSPAAIRGSRELPPAYDHPHASEEARRIGERGTVLRAQAGSGVHGTSISGQDDRDGMGLPPSSVTGLARVPAGLSTTATVEFEQFHRHTVWDRPGGLANRSGAGDLDLVIYAARASGPARAVGQSVGAAPAVRPRRGDRLPRRGRRRADRRRPSVRLGARCLCRRYHRPETFAPGRRSVLAPDGRLRVTTPSGITRTTRPPGLRDRIEQRARPAPPPPPEEPPS